MKLTSEMIKARAAELGIDCIAIGNIERFKGAPKLMSPLTYFPDAKSVIAVAMRIPRGTYRGIEEGTHWHNYTFYSYNKLNSLFRPIKSYELCCFIEDHGWEAVAHYPAVPEGNGTTREPVAPGKVPPDVVCSVRIIAAGCGLGEIGFSKVFLTKKFGPRVRLGLIFTDCELEPDPILDTGEICLHCGACQRECRATPSRPSRTPSGGLRSTSARRRSGSAMCRWAAAPSRITASITSARRSIRRSSRIWRSTCGTPI